MKAIERTSSGVWRGNLPHGSGEIKAASGVLRDAPFTFATRFENAKGTNPEELIAAAHAGCFSMALSAYLSEQGHEPEEISTKATVSLENQAITRVHLVTEGRVPGLREQDFQKAVQEADAHCPVSNLLRTGLVISHEAMLR
ncbi:OsmC family peroxiredoxin [Alkalilimnicola ehrlichii]|uniref:OsmC family peroxiredoxin n=1 Tax=Alkalilimnicola ehrlichii TaxID=351052 RepID=A0A3E0WKP1_9GAMM|nr:OsmC family protein [Alkalilimnicola ehrlichii]RFA25369.1 OsmC family peroxiredoxin [Alkalilimnicola ehrlichii]RFA32546.1 OsmC family peroxiredoxin [Alkalilimnicola ehrlichii]